jgi:hypothetical protein
MGLLIIEHLDSVLNGPQETIARCQVIAGMRIDPASGNKRIKSLQRSPNS